MSFYQSLYSEIISAEEKLSADQIETALIKIKETNDEMHFDDAEESDEDDALTEEILVDNYNLLETAVYKNYTEPLFNNSAEEIVNSLLSPIVTTTSNLTGILNNTALDERLVGRYKTNARVVVIKSNYGTLIEPGYFAKIKPPEPKSNRGRKPKVKAQKAARKKQGNGDCFQSQVTFIVIGNKKNPETVSGFMEYNIKIFRNGKEQIPGCTPDLIDDIIFANSEVIKVLNESLAITKEELRHRITTARCHCSHHTKSRLCLDHVESPNELMESVINTHTNDFPQITARALCIKMKNYKFYVKLNETSNIDLVALKYIMELEKIKDNLAGQSIYNVLKSPCDCREINCQKCYNYTIVNNEKMSTIIYDEDIRDEDICAHPRIVDVIYSYEDVKLSIKFHTPILGSQSKNTLVKIFTGKKISANYYFGDLNTPRGAKINILGGMEEAITKDIYCYLRHIFIRYNKYLITDAVKSDNHFIIVDPAFEDNIIVPKDTPDKVSDLLGPKLTPIILTEKERAQLKSELYNLS